MKAKNGYVLHEIVGEYFIIPIGAESIDNNRMITVNETGRTLWQALQKDISVDGLMKIMLDTYDVDEQVLRADLDSFLAKIRGAGLLEE